MRKMREIVRRIFSLLTSSHYRDTVITRDHAHVCHGMCSACVSFVDDEHGRNPPTTGSSLSALASIRFVTPSPVKTNPISYLVRLLTVQKNGTYHEVWMVIADDRHRRAIEDIVSKFFTHPTQEKSESLIRCSLAFFRIRHRPSKKYKVLRHETILIPES